MEATEATDAIDTTSPSGAHRPAERPRLLVVDDEPVVVTFVVSALEDEGFEPMVARSVAEAMERLEREPAVAIIDKNLPDGSGLEVLVEMRRRWPFSEGIIFTGYPSYDSVVEALRRGAYDYLAKPPRDVEELRHKVRLALERGRLRREREETIAQLQEARRLQAIAGHSEMMAQLGRMLAGVVHELRSPITYIGVNIEVVIAQLQAQPSVNPDMLDALRDALDGVGRINTIVTDIRQVSNIEAFTPGQADRFAVGDAIEQAVGLTRAHLTEHTLEIDVGGGLQIRGSRLRFSQVLVNLILDAAARFEQSGVLRFHAALHGRAIVLTVADTAPARPADELMHLFEPFYSSRNDGAGLALAREIVVEHRGTLEASSTPGVGSTFTITVPAA